MSRAHSGGAGLALVSALLLGVVACSDQPADLGGGVARPATKASPDRSRPSPPASPAPGDVPTDAPPDEPADEPPGEPALLPNGTREVFTDGDFLVAYYGTAGTGSLGVLGERSPAVTDLRLRAAA